MRNTAYYLSHLKESLVEFVKKSTDTTDSKGEEKETVANFYKEFLRENREFTCRIVRTETVNSPKSSFSRCYAVYVIEVKTDSILYEIKKRYSEFQRFHGLLKKIQKLTASFPPRTFFQPGWNEEVTKSRYMQLNKFLEEISYLNRDETAKLQLFKFLQIYENYQEKGIEIRREEPQLLLTDQFLLMELARCNQNSRNILDSLERIKTSLIQRKRRLGYETAKYLLVGFQEHEGLLTIIIKNENQLVITQGLKLLNWLICPESNRQYQIFRRLTSKLLPNSLVLQQFESFRQNCDLSSQYFRLLNFYLNFRQDIDIRSICKFFQQGENIQQQFKRWQKYYSLSY